MFAGKIVGIGTVLAVVFVGRVIAVGNHFLKDKITRELAKLFPSYVNGTKLIDENGSSLELDATGNGSFKEYMKQVVIKSAQRAMDMGIDMILPE